jgi:hypothetical protein
VFLDAGEGRGVVITLTPGNNGELLVKAQATENNEPVAGRWMEVRLRVNENTISLLRNSAPNGFNLFPGPENQKIEFPLIRKDEDSLYLMPDSKAKLSFREAVLSQGKSGRIKTLIFVGPVSPASEFQKIDVHVDYKKRDDGTYVFTGFRIVDPASKNPPLEITIIEPDSGKK